MQIITAPEPLMIQYKSVFLAGSIEQDKALKWQDKVINALKNVEITLINPRRKAWDASWVQSIENANFREQVEWELEGLERADIIVIYFDPNTKSPISLLELGLFAKSKKVIVCCPNGFWRKGNVDIVCHKYGVPQVDSLEMIIEYLNNEVH